MTSRPTITQSKKELRSSLKKVLQQVPVKSINSQSSDVLRTLINLPQFVKAKKIALYMNMPHLEIQTMKIIEHCFQSNKQVYLPRCNFRFEEGRKKNFLSMLRVDSFQEVKSLKPQGRYGLLEPIDGEDVSLTGGLDLIVVPGVAFSKERKRLGHGAGFYDEYISYYNTKFEKRPLLIGIGLKEQLLEDLPTDSHDWNLDIVVIGDLVFN